MKPRLRLVALSLALLSVGISGGYVLAYLSADTNDKPGINNGLSTTQKPQRTQAELEAERVAVEAKRKEVELTVENLVKFTNEERVKSGLQTVTLNPLLNASAQAKAVDMATKNYWAHNAPDGSQPWLFITAQGYSYTAAGENLACSFTSSKAVLDGWMNSPKHKENVLNPVFTEVGFGVIKAQYYICGNIPAGENYIVVQHFATPY